MAQYPDLDEIDKLWPEDGYAVIVEDEMKPPDSDDFVNVLSTFDEVEALELPEPRQSYSYWVHDADGNRYERDAWAVHQARMNLVNAVEEVRSIADVEETLDALKSTGRSRWQRDDVIWFEVVLSMATLGNSAGASLVVDEDGNIVEERYQQVSYDTITSMDPDSRLKQLSETLNGYNVRYHNKKAKALVSNYELIAEEYGTPVGAKKAFDALDGVEEKLTFLQQFQQIGEKYARNIGMDLYDLDFRECIAIDSRIENLCQAAGNPLDGRSYEAKAEFVRSIADELEIEPWELDRILYNYDKEILQRL